VCVCVCINLRQNIVGIRVRFFETRCINVLTLSTNC